MGSEVLILVVLAWFGANLALGTLVVLCTRERHQRARRRSAR